MSNLSFFDTHAHLPMLKHDSLDAILERSRSAGVDSLVTVATEPENWTTSAECARQLDNVYYSIGMHPHSAKDWRTHRDDFRERVQNRDRKCVAIGEIGLDFYYGFSEREQQLECLREQLEVARDHKLPIIVHCREAFADFFSILGEVGLSEAGGVMHCFTGTSPDATRAVDLGMFISFSGILTFKNAGDLRATAARLPLSSIVIETDCPFLAPLSKRGKPNEPSFLPETAAMLGEVTKTAISEIAEVTTANASRLFRVTRRTDDQ